MDWVSYCTHNNMLLCCSKCFFQKNSLSGWSMNLQSGPLMDDAGKDTQKHEFQLSNWFLIYQSVMKSLLPMLFSESRIDQITKKVQVIQWFVPSCFETRYGAILWKDNRHQRWDDVKSIFTVKWHLIYSRIANCNLWAKFWAAIYVRLPSKNVFYIIKWLNK